MSYLTQHTISTDPAMTGRVAQAAAGEGAPGDPDAWTWQWRRAWASAPGWDDARESAQAGGIPDPGADESVITDAMILAQVQAMLGSS